MIRHRLIIVITAVLVLGTGVSHAQGAKKKSSSSSTKTASAPSSANEIAALRELIEGQSKQIQALTEQVAHLAQLVEASRATPAPAPAATPTPVVSHTPSPVENTGPAGAVAGQDGPGTHVVTKGETLTSIAKHYKTTVAELLKLNKIENDRMLQIGQTLVIPTPTPVDNPQEKKENQ